MKKVDQIDCVKNIFLSKEGVSYQIGNNISLVNEEVLELNNNDFIDVISSFLYKRNTTISIFDNGSFNLLPNSEDAISCYYINPQLYIFSFLNETDWNTSYKVYDHNNYIFLDTHEELGLIYFDETSIISQDNNKNHILSLNLNGQHNWSFNYPKDFKLFWHIQVVDNVLFFAMDNDKTRESKSIGIDINTGKQLWEIDKSICLQINPDNHLLYGYSARIYKVVNPKTGELLVNKSMLSYFEDGICPYSFNNTIGGGKLWFVSGRGEKTKFGAIDLETSEMNFIQDFPLDKDFQFSKSVHHEGKLYLLDSNNVLRVFE